MIRHFTASAFVCDSQNRVLLLWHKKLMRWMPPGGHIDENELPEDAAKRECKEETGLDVEILSESQTDLFDGNAHEGRMLKMPHTMLLEEIPSNGDQPAHQHMDFVFLAKPVDDTQMLKMAKDEADHLKWFTKEEIEKLSSDEIFGNVRSYVLSTMV
jgi:ADP-ribose pyrophosphatase YjhB (NUDIX family)